MANRGNVAGGISRRIQGKNDKTPWGSTHRVLCYTRTAEISGLDSGSPGRTRTADRVVNSHLLYQLSYRGIVGTYAARDQPWDTVVPAAFVTGHYKVILLALSIIFLPLPAPSPAGSRS
jgi:hypothetical protein